VSATGAFARKELSEVLHTWRLWVLPGLLVFAGITSPVMAALLPRLAKYAAGESPGTVITIADPTATDAYLQFVGNLQQLGSLAIVIIGAGLIAAEVRSGTAALTLAKPLSRTGYVLTKAGMLAGLTVAATAIGAIVCIAVTAAVFGPGDVGGMLAATACWLLLAMLLVAVATLLSAAVRSQMAAAVAGVGVVIAVGVLGQIGLIRDFTPAGLSSAGSSILTGEPAALAVPIVSTVALVAVLLLAAVAVFRRREI